ncbi:MAG: cob(I)yrinic acid a,c-diamide adenosyltransferase [Chloroflexota bacterium]|nr:cob(I)yrinic acid a,c-diamide adenosyltransferase [Chloroflexota bacterium]
MASDNPFFTRSGDEGYTGILGHERVAKYDLQPEACGTLDEVSAVLGVARAAANSQLDVDIIVTVQRDLYDAMADLAMTPEAAAKAGCRLEQSRVNWLESMIEELGKEVELPPAFVVPGDSYAGAMLDVARTVTRRAERLVAKLYHQALLCNPAVLQYLNRLSSLLFVVARFEDIAAGVTQFTLAKPEEDR